MPTNRTRLRRAPRRQIPVEITAEYIRRLKFLDFVGELSDEEVVIAKKHGVYRFDGWAKARRANASLHTGGER